MQSESQLLKKLESQIKKIEKFVLDLQKDFVWQRVFYRQKHYLKLQGIFNKNYTEYSKYLEDIINDYKKLVHLRDSELKVYYIEKIENKIFALFKILRSLSKNKKATESLYDAIQAKQQQIGGLIQQQQTLVKMLDHLDSQYKILNNKLLYSTVQLTDKQREDLKIKLIKLLAKKGQMEQDLFSLKERISLLS